MLHQREAQASTADHKYGHVSRGAASTLAALRPLRHRHAMPRSRALPARRGTTRCVPYLWSAVLVDRVATRRALLVAGQDPPWIVAVGLGPGLLGPDNEATLPIGRFVAAIQLSQGRGDDLGVTGRGTRSVDL
jgi:hypothetical protein